MQSHSKTSSDTVCIIAYAFANDVNICLETENITFLLILSILAYSSSVLLHPQTGIVKFLQDIATIEEVEEHKIRESILLFLNYSSQIVKKNSFVYCMTMLRV